MGLAAREIMAGMIEKKSNRVKVAILGATGMVGRKLAALLADHPDFELSMLVGSGDSSGQGFQSVWEKKENDLQKHYGAALWQPQLFPPALTQQRISTFRELLDSSIEVIFSSIPERAGHLEEQLLTSGRTVFSNSPYRRFDDDVALIVPEVNAEAMRERRLIKNPNCVTSGLVLVLQPVMARYGVKEVAVTTYQSLSGRGDAKYHQALVLGNILPLHGSEENTEEYIRLEINKVLNARFRSSITCNRTCVQVGHFVEVRMKTQRPVDDAEELREVLAGFNPLEGLSVRMNPARPIVVIQEQGRPRPVQDVNHHEGMAIAVGNISTRDEVFDLRLTYVVNNLVRGAAGGAVLNAEIWRLRQKPELIEATVHEEVP